MSNGYRDRGEVKAEGAAGSMESLIAQESGGGPRGVSSGCAAGPPELGPGPGGAGRAAGVTRLRGAGIVLVACLLGGGVLTPLPASGQERPSPDPETLPGATVVPDTLVIDPPDTFRDAGARRLVLRAREARHREVQGISHYEAVLRQRAYLGLRAAAFRRERGIIEEERVGQVRWEQEGEVTVAWLGGRRSVPFVAGSGAAEESIQRDLARDLLRGGDVGPVLAGPGDDRLAFGGNSMLHPLADSAGRHYRYSSGDTLRLGLPDGRTVTLVEARVEPREARFDRVAGSLWFDDDQGGLVRATYRPARPFDLEVDEPGDASDVPGFLKPIRAEIRYVTVDHSLHDFRWWLPRRWAFEGEVQLGRLARFPITLEWLMEDYAVNEAASALPGGDRLPPGWSRAQREVRRRGEPTRYVTVLVPPATELVQSPRLLGPSPGSAPTAFSPDEIREARAVLEGLLPRELRPGPTLGWGFSEGMVRYNRVEGLSVGARGVLPVSPITRLLAEARIGYGDAVLNGELSVERSRGAGERLALTAFRRLEPSSEWTSPFSFGSSLQSAVAGGERDPFHRTLGVEAAIADEGRRLRWELRLFGERHGEVERGTRYHLLHPITGRDMPALQPVEEGDVLGAAGLLRWQRGLDPEGLIASGSLRGEATVGDLPYQRVSATVALVHPLPGSLAGALEIGAGVGGGRLPPQRRFFLGGTSTLRGLKVAELPGESFWMARTEVGTGLPGFRLAAFSDLGWAGPRNEMRRGQPVASAGVGASLLDGLVRLDVARMVKGGDALRLHLYLDGLF